MSKYSKQLASKQGLAKLDFSKGDMFKYIRSYGVLTLEPGRSKTLESGENEVGLLILEGKCDIEIDGKKYKELGSRDSVFSGIPAGVYIPRGKSYKIKSRGVSIAVCAGKCDKTSEFAIINPNEVKVMQVGKDNWARDVRIIIGPHGPSVNLILGETLNPPGNWSGTPAHRHEVDNLPTESLHEELYYFKTDKPQGFGVEKFYSPQRKIDELIPLKEGTVTFMPFGYHQIVAGPGYNLYYLFFLAGVGKQLVGAPDSVHTWINE